jgi:hypothetical protein
MDRLDRFSLFVIIILLISSLALMGNHMGEARSRLDDQQKGTSKGPVINSKIEHKVKSIRDILDGGNLVKAEILAKELIQEHLLEGEPRILMGDIFMRKHEPIMAVLEYKEAIDINPDYLDRQTPMFQGKKMEVAVKEALSEIERNIEKNPEDKSMKKYRKDVYYLQRRLAGGCS